VVDLVAYRAWKENVNIALQPTPDAPTAMVWCLTKTTCAGDLHSKLPRPQNDTNDTNDHAAGAGAPVAVIRTGISHMIDAATIGGDVIEVETLTRAEVMIDAGYERLLLLMYRTLYFSLCKTSRGGVCHIETDVKSRITFLLALRIVLFLGYAENSHRLCLPKGGRERRFAPQQPH
jgi:hypothetical protein